MSDMFLNKLVGYNSISVSGNKAPLTSAMLQASPQTSPGPLEILSIDGKGGLLLPRGGMSDRPSPAGFDGLIRYNIESQSVEFVINGAWKPLSGSGSLLGDYIPLVGGVMTGPLTLTAISGETNRRAATVGYVDSLVTPVSSAAGSAVKKSGDTMTGPLILSEEPNVNSNALQAASKSYVDAVSTIVTTKLSKSGDIYTGDLQFNNSTNARVILAQGSQIRPALAFQSDLTTGIYSPSIQKITFVTNSSDRLIIQNSDVTVTGKLIVAGDFEVQGTLALLKAETLQILDKNIELNKIAAPDDISADGAGLTVKGTTDKTLKWLRTNSSWRSSENFDVDVGKDYRIDGTTVLSASTLGSSIVNSSLTKVGTITSGVWNGSLIPTSFGGTGAALTPNLGGIVYGNTTGLAISASPAPGQVPMSGPSTTPIWISAVSGSDANSLVVRDASGNFSAGTITASLTGVASGNLKNVTDTFTGTLTVSGAIKIGSPTVLNTLAGTLNSQRIVSDAASITDLTVTGGVVVGTPTGSNKGAGTINATKVYVNGTEMAPSPITVFKKKRYTQTIAANGGTFNPDLAVDLGVPGLKALDCMVQVTVKEESNTSGFQQYFQGYNYLDGWNSGNVRYALSTTGSTLLVRNDHTAQVTVDILVTYTA